ncbi:MAG TPA: BadF/BadG/BcrA/BcrD ATPase family protein [Chloroflexota bacterium]|nr:BadF/BadG/BcrA/BcrD ATPase family protein [Chloroflexota bacterium]
MYLGIDLGGSGTRAVLVDGNGQLLATGQGGPSGHLGGPAGRRLLGRALDATLAPIAPLIHGAKSCVIHAGTTGLSIPGRGESLFLEFSRRFPGADVRVSNDALIALWGGLAGRQGVAVLAGTGSIALARAADGREARSGGWGYLLGDEGGGYWLGRQAITAYLRWLEGRGGPSALFDLVEAAIGRVSTVSEVIAWLNATASHVSRLASLAPLVSQAAATGDAQAIAILDRAGQALAELAVSAACQLWPAGLTDGLAVACCGGVWAAGRVLEAPFAAALQDGLPNATVSPPQLSPVAGAVLLAMGASTAPVPQVVLDRLKRIR